MSFFHGLLSAQDNKRDNNFTIIRILCAWLVLYGHSYALQNPTNMQDPLNLIFKGSNYIGGFAVDAFFIISGYLVTASIVRQGVGSYFISRVLRVFPALICCVLLSIFVLGWAVTALDSKAYFSNPKTFNYFINMVPFIDIQFFLPGVFEHNVEPAVNGSLWTLIVELRCYFLLMVAYMLGVFKTRKIANFFLFGLLLFGVFFYKDLPLLGKGVDIHWPALSLFFLIGVIFYINREDIILDPKLAILSIILIFLSFGADWFKFVFPIAFAYFIFYAAYSLPFFNADKKIGDISYGIYIYAYPVQGLIAYLFPGLHPPGNTIAATIIVLPLAYISWHYIEKPALSLKSRLSNLGFIAKINTFFR